MVDIHVIPPWLDDLEVIPLHNAKHAPNDQSMVAVNCLCK